MPWASRGSLGDLDAEDGEAWKAPALQGGNLGGGPRPLPSPGPRLRDAPGRICSALPRPPPPYPLQTEKDLSPLNIQTFFVFIFFQGRSNIFQMRQNRDGSEAFSAGACVSAGRGFRLCLGAFLPTARSPLSFGLRNFESCVFSGSRLLALSDSVFCPGCRSPCLTVCVSLSLPDSISLAFPLASSIPAQSVSKFLAPSKLSDPPSWQGTVGPQEGKRSPGFSACGLPAPAPLPARPRRPRPLAPGLSAPRHRRRCHLRAPRPELEF